MSKQDFKTLELRMVSFHSGQKTKNKPHPQIQSHEHGRGGDISGAQCGGRWKRSKGRCAEVETFVLTLFAAR